MTKILWDVAGSRLYETGLDRGVLYPATGAGVPWNGLLSVTEKVQGGESLPLYFDGLKYFDSVNNEDFNATLEALSAPAEFWPSDGGKALATGLYALQQPRLPFGLSYRTLIGNDTKAGSYGYKLHIIWNAMALPSERGMKSLSDGSNPLTLSWEINASPLEVGTYKPTSHFVVNSVTANATKLAALEALLYGTSSVAPTLPTQATVISTLT